MIREGVTVRVRDEPSLSVVVQAADGMSSCDIADVPPVLDVCCVPIVLVRTPNGDDHESGVLRWVALEDVTLVSTLDFTAVIA